jgi:hypothetical protein
VYGIASDTVLEDLPNFAECNAENVDALITATLIKNARFSNPQSAFIQMLKMLFMQPGKGRRESTLYQGVGSRVDKATFEKMLRLLLEEKIVTRHKGDYGYVYKPVRNRKGRINKIMNEGTLSEDPLWETISKLN